MARLSLTPTVLPGTGSGAPLNATAALQTLTPNTGVSFSNPGNVWLHVLTSGASNATVNIGTTIEGQAVGGITLTLVSTATNIIGPFPLDENTSAGVVTVDFGTPANVTSAALLQY